MLFAKLFISHRSICRLCTLLGTILVKMPVRFLILLVFVLGMIYAEPYNCKGDYNPSDYIGKLRVPTDCKVEQLDCTASWKSGIPEGSESSVPMIDQKFLNCHEGFTLCGYVPIDPKSGEVLGHSGVTVGAGVDFGSKSTAYFTSLSISPALVDKVEPYFGLEQDLAACAAIERPLRLTLAEANTLTDAVRGVCISSSRYSHSHRQRLVSVWLSFG